MSMKAMYDLRDMLCKELDEIAHKGELGAGDLDIAHKLVSTIKNIDKIDLMDDEGYSRDGDYSQRRYSRDGDHSQRGYSRDSYGGGSSYARRGTHYVRGHYSRDGAKDDMKRQLQEMLDNADARKWICVAADVKQAAYTEHYVLLVMSSVKVSERAQSWRV